jgi:hypothetical protein
VEQVFQDKVTMVALALQVLIALEVEVAQEQLVVLAVEEMSEALAVQV